MSPLLIATTNPGKIREIRRVLEGVDVTLVTMGDLPPIVEPDETGRTFADNARLKAAYYAAASGLPTVAEDSGLAIDALGGRPGVESARYPGATYPEKFANLYGELAPYPRPWTARFVCAVAFVDRALGNGQWALEGERASLDRLAFECTATVEGEIAPGPRGAHGFGYNPISSSPVRLHAGRGDRRAEAPRVAPRAGIPRVPRLAGLALTATALKGACTTPQYQSGSRQRARQ